MGEIDPRERRFEAQTSVLTAPGAADVVPGAEVGHVRSFLDGRAVAALQDEVDEPLHVGGRGARRRDADRGQAVFAGRLDGLVVEVPHDLHVVAHEAERHDDDRSGGP